MVTFPKDGAGAAIANGTFSRKLKSTVVSGAAANTNITLAGIDPACDNIISVTALSGGSLKSSVVAGAAATTNIAISGIETTDKIVSVVRLDRDATAANINISDVTSEASITSNGNIQLSTTNTTGDALLVLWQDYSFGDADFTASTSIFSRGVIRVSSSTAGAKLLVVYSDNSVNG